MNRSELFVLFRPMSLLKWTDIVVLK